MAQIGWIDFSPDHRDRVAAVLDMLKPEGVVDELGIGSIRDALADEMFPGISTIQTRAKYFFIIPYLLYDYQRLSSAQQKKISPDKYLENQEYEVMWKLAEQYEHKEGIGVIGITKYRPQKIMRRPSAIYWNGLAVFDLIRHGRLGVNSFLQSRAGMAESLAAVTPQGDDSPRDDLDVEYTNRFHLKLPYDQDWLKNLSLDLTQSEAKLLSDRIRATGKECLISSLVENRARFKVLENANTFADFCRVSVNQKLLSPEIQSRVVLAHDFSEVMFGAHCAYNCILQKQKFSLSTFEDNWSDWRKALRTSMLDYNGFDMDEAISLAPNLRSHTSHFVRDWWQFSTSSSQSIQKRNALVETQEFNTKRHKARIRQNRHDDVSDGKWIGLSRLDYRMYQVKAILKDVFTGLKGT